MREITCVQNLSVKSAWVIAFIAAFIIIPCSQLSSPLPTITFIRSKSKVCEYCMLCYPCDVC